MLDESPASAASLVSLMRRRRSVREFRDTPVPRDLLVRLLGSVWRMHVDEARGVLPSAGASHLLRFGVVAHRIESLARGAYACRDDAALECVAPGPAVGEALAASGIGAQPWLREAAAVIVVSGDRPTMLDRFADQQPDGRRGDRYLAMEAGGAVQNLALGATALGLGGVVVGGFDDRVAHLALHPVLASGHVPLALFPVGYPAAEPRIG